MYLSGSPDWVLIGRPVLVRRGLHGSLCIAAARPLSQYLLSAAVEAALDTAYLGSNRAYVFMFYGFIDTYAGYVDSRDMSTVYVDVLRFYRHIIPMCRYRRHSREKALCGDILLNQFPLKCLFQDALAEGFGLFEAGGDGFFEFVADA